MEEPITHLLLGVFGLPLAVGILLVIFVGIPAWREFWSKRKIKLDGDFDLTIDIPKSSFAEVIRSPDLITITMLLRRGYSLRTCQHFEPVLSGLTFLAASLAKLTDGLHYSEIRSCV